MRKDSLDRVLFGVVPASSAFPSISALSRSVPDLSVRVLLFDVLRRELGVAELDAAVPAGATAGDLLDQLAAAHAPIHKHRPVVRVAVNRRYVPVETALGDDDEVALITPVSGG